YLWVFLVGAVTLEGMELLHMAYEAGGEWEIISTLLTEHLAVSYGVIQVLIGAVVPFFLLLVAFIPRFPTRLLAAVSGLASVLVLVQVFAMRWNVVVGGQLFSKSFRGFVEFPLHWLGREGILAASVIMVLPLIALWLAAKIVPLWQEAEAKA
ncbi:MAG: polysulfide reductase, partial [Planctomycetes bacterium]|nr:polysulfide reductase [Planctomycetota bacterium]